jgi:uncharacterized protein (TIGR00299 family) protein
MKTLFLDLFSGISGDMVLGALLDLGVDRTELERQLERLGVSGYHLHVSRGARSGITGTKVDVHIDHLHHHGDEPGPEHKAGHGHESDHGPEHDHDPGHAHGHEHGRAPDHAPEHEPGQHHGHGPEPGANSAHDRDFRAIAELIGRSPLPDWTRTRAIAVFRRIAEAEGQVHGRPPERVHFHEVGALDSIVDVVGACIAFDLLGRPQVCASPVIDGTGWVRCAHGRFPVPTPATIAILAARGVAVGQCAEPNELVTPTGAAILAEFADSFGLMPTLCLERVGYGLGTRENITRPNVLRAVLGERPSTAAAAAHDWETDTVAVLETHLDDVTPEVLGQFMATALAAGALDVAYTPLQMKKNRPGFGLTVLGAPEDADRLTALILRQTTAFGVRRTLAERRKLRREFQTVPTPFGEVTVKLGRLDGATIQSAPEFESCQAAAARADVPLKAVYAAALRALDAPRASQDSGS